MNELEIVPTQRTHLLCERNVHVLVIVDVSPEDAGEYVCQAENIHGKVTCKTTLTVIRELFSLNS